LTNEPSSSAAAKNSGTSATYAMGTSDHERKRLMRQGAILREPLAAAFRAAGITSGMRVLDIGCGVGDVSILAAELVGPSGSVVGLDRDPASVAWATARVAEGGFTNIKFCAGEFGEFSDPQPFDALVGRFILMYLPAPEATLRFLGQYLRGDARIAFLEPDFTVPSCRFPSNPDFSRYETWMTEVFRRSGARPDMGMRLYRTYRDAGFVDTATMISHLSGCGINRQMIDYFVETVRSLLPKILEFGIATREEIGIDTLADRMEAVARETDPQWVGTRYIAAWARKPAR
jgi:SAM-dependent methyltransferase